MKQTFVSIAMATALSACGIHNDYAPPKHMNHVSSAQEQQHFYFEYDAKTLSPRETAYMEQMLAKLDPAGVTEAVIHGVGKESAWTAEDKAILKRRVASVRKALISRGVPAERIIADESVGAAQASQSTGPYYQAVKVEIISFTRAAPECPDWTKPYGNASNTVHSNHGCANINNLGAMAADPSDLLGKRYAIGAHAPVSSRIVGDYRAGTFQPQAITGQTSTSGGGG